MVKKLWYVKKSRWIVSYVKKTGRPVGKKNRRRFQVGSREAVPSPPLAPELASWRRADLGLLSRTLLAADVLGPYPQRRHEDNTG
jgi:hypothetical protein